MAISRHPRRVLLPTLALFAVVGCGDSGSGETDEATTQLTPQTTSSATTVDSTGDDPTTLPGTTTNDPTNDPTQDPTTTTITTDPETTSSTSDPGTTTTDETTTTTDTTTSDDTTGAIETNEQIPEIPDDGMPSSAHFKKIPLGMSAAKQGFWEYTPPGYGGGEKYPLMIFLHGIGENGNGDSELDKVPNNGIPGLIKNNNWDTTRPFVVLSPQHPGGGCPGSAEVHDFIDFAVNNYDINPGRVYLTGLSCGAIGAWGYLGDYLDQQIVAMVPIAGDGKGAFNKAKCELGKTPIWAFHGDKDGTVLPSGTTEPVTALQMCDPKPDVEMVIYPGVGHDSWSMTYNLSAGHDIYTWFLKYWRP